MSRLRPANATCYSFMVSDPIAVYTRECHLLRSRLWFVEALLCVIERAKTSDPL